MKVQQYTNEIIDMYCNQNLNTVQIAKIFGCSDSAIGRLLERNGIKRIHTPNELNLTDEQIIDICKRYINGEITEKISKDYNVCGNSIAKIIKNKNIQIRAAKKYSVIKNHNYFENIDSIDKAYFLGWMISDGAIIENKTRPNREKTISIEIQNKDRRILELFANVLEADESIIKVFEQRDHAHIRFSSNKMAEDLAKYGVVPRKSYISYLPKLNKELMPHLIRGIFDGDGTITIDKKKQAHIAFYGSENICTQITEYLHNELNINKNKVSKSTCYHVWYGGNNVAKIIKNFMYNNCGIYYLERKYLKFNEIT